MNSLSEFFAMGGYAVYVWTAYSLTMIVLFINFVYPIRKEERLIKKLINRSKRRNSNL